MPNDLPQLSPEQVRKIANLARLTVDTADETRLAREMTGILSYIKKLEELDVSAVPPTSHAVDLPTKLRQDAMRDGLPLDRAMQNAPERLGDGFGVPKIIE